MPDDRVSGCSYKRATVAACEVRYSDRHDITDMATTTFMTGTNYIMKALMMGVNPKYST